jgi:type IV pilus assembly protein PilZ
MRKIEVRFLRRESFRDVFLPNLDGGGIFIESAEEFEVGEVLELNLLFPEIPEGVAIRGTVAWRRPPARWRSALPAGIGVEFRVEDRSRVAFLDDFSRGGLEAVRKQGRRIPLGLKVDIMSGSGLISARTGDISRGGLFVVTPSDFELDEEVVLRLFFESDGAPEQLAGRVAWKRRGVPAAGVGIQFLFPSPQRRQRIGRVVGDIESRFLGPAISI